MVSMDLNCLSLERNTVNILMFLRIWLSDDI